MWIPLQAGLLRIIRVLLARFLGGIHCGMCMLVAGNVNDITARR